MTKTNLDLRITGMINTITPDQINEYFTTTAAPDYRDMIAESGLADALPPFELEEMLGWYEGQLAAELEDLEDKKFMLAMKDRWDAADREADQKMARRILQINKLLNPQPPISEPSEEEKAILEAEMHRLLNSNEDPNFERYGMLERRLLGKVPYDPELLPRKAG